MTSWRVEEGFDTYMCLFALCFWGGGGGEVKMESGMEKERKNNPLDIDGHECNTAERRLV